MMTLHNPIRFCMLAVAILLCTSAYCVATEGGSAPGAVQGFFRNHGSANDVATAVPQSAPAEMPANAMKGMSGAILQAIQEKGFATVYIQFGFNSDVIADESKSQVEAIYSVLQEQKSLCLRIAGHTDAIGDTAYNRELSLRRSQSVLAALTGVGITGTRLRAEGYGPDQPVADNKTAEGRAKNRRVELHKMECP